MKTFKNIQKNIKSFANPVIVPFKPSAKIEKICQKNHWLLAAPSAKNNRLLEDKIKFYQQCQKAKLPLIDSLILPFNQKNFSKAQQAYGSNLVIQSHFGWAGNSTTILIITPLLKNTFQKICWLSFPLIFRVFLF